MARCSCFHLHCENLVLRFFFPFFFFLLELGCSIIKSAELTVSCCLSFLLVCVSHCEIEVSFPGSDEAFLEIREK